MFKSIKYFEEECINRFEKLEDDFMKEPQKLAEYVLGLTEELHNLGLRMIQESLEEMNEMIRKSQKRLQHWGVEAHETKQLITSLGTVKFEKTLFKNKETGKCEYLLDRIVGLEGCLESEIGMKRIADAKEYILSNWTAAKLRAYELNNGDMLALVRYQKHAIPKVVGAEYDVLSSAEIIQSEKK